VSDKKQFVVVSSKFDSYSGSCSFIHRDLDGRRELVEDVPMLYRNKSVASKVRRKANRDFSGQFIEEPYDEKTHSSNFKIDPRTHCSEKPDFFIISLDKEQDIMI
jgi:hypothetical protein